MLGLLLDLPSLSFLIISKITPTSTSINLRTAGTHFFCSFLFRLYVSKNTFFFSFCSIIFSPFSQALSPHLPVLLFLARFPEVKAVTLFYSAV